METGIIAEKKAGIITDSIIKEMDKMILLGAAFDCMSEKGQQKFREKVSKIIFENLI